jgi:hypothetical protein
MYDGELIRTSSQVHEAVRKKVTEVRGVINVAKIGNRLSGRTPRLVAEITKNLSGGTPRLVAEITKNLSRRSLRLEFEGFESPMQRIRAGESGGLTCE